MANATLPKVLLSLHGFHSSPASLKVQQMRDYLLSQRTDIKFICPQLPVYPKDMWCLIESVFAQYQDHDVAIMGSSLGGFLATKAAQQYGAKALLINPAVAPHLLFNVYQGKQIHPYLQQTYQIDNQYIQQIEALTVENIIDPDNIWVLLQQQDEVLDYRDAMKKYKHCKITCEKGGNHSFVGFDRYLENIIHFLY